MAASWIKLRTNLSTDPRGASVWRRAGPLLGPNGMRNAVIPSAAGVYALYDDDGLLYIGSSEDLRRRIWVHFNDRSLFFRAVKYRVSVKFGDWLMIEARLIRRIQPPLNMRFTNRKCGRMRGVGVANR